MYRVLTRRVSRRQAVVVRWAVMVPLLTVLCVASYVGRRTTDGVVRGGTVALASVGEGYPVRPGPALVAYAQAHNIVLAQACPPVCTTTTTEAPTTTTTEAPTTTTTEAPTTTTTQPYVEPVAASDFAWFAIVVVFGLGLLCGLAVMA